MSTEVTSTVEVRTVSSAAAQELLAATVRAAEKQSLAVSVAVFDAAGAVIAFLRMDGASVRSSEVAHSKGYTAVSFGLASDQWYGLIEGDGATLHSLPHLDRFTMLGGGYPLTIDGQLVGSIGVSGAPSAEGDMSCASAALAESPFEG